jgi:hypothetical protein
MLRLKENLERAMSVEPVLDGKGHPTGLYKYQGAVANRALELLRYKTVQPKEKYSRR